MDGACGGGSDWIARAESFREMGHVCPISTTGAKMSYRTRFQGDELAHTPPVVLETSRLILRAARRTDAASLFTEYTGRNDAARYLQRSAHPSQARTEAIIDALGEGNWQATNRFAWSILQRPDERPIGLFLMFIDGSRAEIHYGLGPAFWGQGLATEAGLAVMDWVMGQSSLSEVSTSCATAHTASLRVLEKIGLRRIELRPGDLLQALSGIRMDAWLYSWKRTAGFRAPDDTDEAFFEVRPL